MPAFPLRVLDGETPHIDGAAEQLAGWLVPPHDPSLTDRIGEERVLRQEGPLVVLRGTRFRVSTGWAQGYRYLLLGETSAPLAVLNVTQVRREGRTTTLASNVYVLPAHRRKGHASRLLAAARQDFPRLRADTAMTEDGAALLGYEKTHPSPCGEQKRLRP